MKNLLFLQSGRFAMEINANDKGTAADIIISFRPAYSDSWIELVKYIVSCGPFFMEADNRRLAEAIMECSAEVTADMLKDLSQLGKIFSEKMGELNERLNDAEG